MSDARPTVSGIQQSWLWYINFMLMIMGGFPYSGKTEFVKQLSNSMEARVIHINPQSALPEEYESFDQPTKQIWNVSAWEVGYDHTVLALSENADKTVVVFDTAASKSAPLEPLVKKAQQYGHHVLYVFVHSNINDRKVRSNNSDQLRLWESNYASEFKTTIPALTKMADRSWVVKNVGTDLAGINRSVNQIAKYVEAINGKND